MLLRGVLPVSNNYGLYSISLGKAFQGFIEKARSNSYSDWFCIEHVLLLDNDEWCNSVPVG